VFEIFDLIHLFGVRRARW